MNYVQPGSLIVLDVLPSLRRRPWLSARFFDRKIKRISFDVSARSYLTAQQT